MVQPAIDTRGMSRETWLEHRRSGIGGSDAAAILGVNPYRGAYAVWADKIGLEYGSADSEPMRQGRDLEDYVATRFSEETGIKVRRVNRMLISPDHPWMYANIDRQVIGERAGLECKTSRDIYLKRFRNGDYPLEYYAQCQHYMAVTGATHWYLAVLVFGTQFLWFKIPRDEEDIAQLVAAEQAFWEHHVLANVAPPGDGTRGTSEAIKAMHPESDGSILETQDSDLVRLWEIKEQIKRLEALEKEEANRIKAIMGDAERMGSPSYLATWANRGMSSFDKAALQEAWPDIDLDAYTTTTYSRTFTIRRNKEAF